VAAHAVGDQREALVLRQEHRVLVVVALAADMCGAREPHALAVERE
jgi:hypothetical protein